MCKTRSIQILWVSFARTVASWSSVAMSSLVLNNRVSSSTKHRVSSVSAATASRRSRCDATSAGPIPDLTFHAAYNFQKKKEGLELR